MGVCGTVGIMKHCSTTRCTPFVVVVVFVVVSLLLPCVFAAPYSQACVAGIGRGSYPARPVCHPTHRCLRAGCLCTIAKGFEGVADQHGDRFHQYVVWFGVLKSI